MTPNSIDKEVEKLLRLVNATHEPEYLDVTPEPGAKESDCFIVVRNKIKKNGGKMIMGWQIWKTNNLIEAEAHSVWEDLDGDIFDLTPKENGATRILFVEDENLIYNDRQIDNIRLNISNNPLVDDLIEVSKAIYRFYNLGERADLYDLTDILSEKQLAHIEYLKQMQYYISALLNKNGKRKSSCPCGTRISFKDCHSKDLPQRVARIV